MGGDKGLFFLLLIIMCVSLLRFPKRSIKIKSKKPKVISTDRKSYRKSYKKIINRKSTLKR